jgi:proteasome accessory factor B
VRAIEDRRLTVITYQSLRSTEPVTHYDVHPHALVWHQRALYLIAWSAGHEDMRTFKVDRLSAADVQALQFTRRPGFEADRFLAGSLGIFQGDGPAQTVRIRFSPQVARYVQESTWHKSQTLELQPDGSVLAEFRLSNTVEIKSWLLSFGQHAENAIPSFE